jgi:hypothetical protein
LCVDRVQAWENKPKRLKTKKVVETAEVDGEDDTWTGNIIYLEEDDAARAKELLKQIKDEGKWIFDRSVIVHQLILFSKLPASLTNVFGNGLPEKIALRNDVFYSTLWNTQPPEEWREYVRSYCFEKSPDFLADTLLKNPIAWRILLSSCQDLFGNAGAAVFHKSAIRKAITAPDLNDTDKQLIQAMEDYVRFEYDKSSLALLCNPNDIQMSPEEEEIVKIVFNVETINGSDIGILKSYDFIDPSGQWFNSLVECNPALEVLLGVRMKVFAEMLYGLKDVPICDAIYWAFDFPYWAMLFEFSVGSAFKRPAWISEIVKVRTGSGELVPCLMHAFASYDMAGVRVSTTICIKPLSPTFKPPKLMIEE